MTDKTATIIWDSRELKKLLIKRAVYSPDISQYLEYSAESLDAKQDDYFNMLFPIKVYPGAKEAKTMSWIIDRSKDGLGGVYPREIINFGNYAVDAELENGEQLDSDAIHTESLLSGVSIRNAFEMVSKVKVESYLSEFTELKKHFERFTGQQTAEFTQSSLISLMHGLQPEGEDMIKALHETGVLEYSTGQVLTPETKIKVPRLFRLGLGIVTFGRP